MWLNKSGLSLVALIVAITLTSLMGIGVASFLVSKQKSLVPQAQSFKAFSISQAGVEFAIRYAYDNKDRYDFPTVQFPKKVFVEGGSFRISYIRETSGSLTLTSEGRYEIGGQVVAVRTIELRNFGNYANIP